MAKNRDRAPKGSLATRGERDTVEGREASADDRCPNCGGEFRDVPERPISKDSTRAGAIQAAREKLTDDRGQLQACAGCDYTRRANDVIEEARA